MRKQQGAPDTRKLRPKPRKLDRQSFLPNVPGAANETCPLGRDGTFLVVFVDEVAGVLQLHAATVAVTG